MTKPKPKKKTKAKGKKRPSSAGKKSPPKAKGKGRQQALPGTIPDAIPELDEAVDELKEAGEAVGAARERQNDAHDVAMERMRKHGKKVYRASSGVVATRVGRDERIRIKSEKDSARA